MRRFELPASAPAEGAPSFPAGLHLLLVPFLVVVLHLGSGAFFPVEFCAVLALSASGLLVVALQHTVLRSSREFVVCPTIEVLEFELVPFFA